MKKTQNALVRLIAFFCFALLTVDAYAQNGVEARDRKVMTAYRLGANESIDLDGRLDEAVWKRATPAAGFIQIDPNNGAPPTEATEVYVVFDQNRLYMGVICHDSEPDKLMGNTMLRDAFLSADDRFMWVFDTYLDARSGYFFEINPSGAMGDSLLGGSDGRSWDGIWTAKVNRGDLGWTAEIEVPFRTLNFDPTAQAWGINFQRTVRRKAEESIWTGFARNQDLRSLSTAGLLAGLSDISQGAGIEIKPYLIGSAGAAPARGLANSYTGDTGVDIGYSITPKLRASFTVNTDFAETEVDDRIVNLTRFPVRFPEKRPFFLEGSNYFTLTGFDTAFFSRRIGLNEGQVQRIDYGAKLIGQVGSEDLGILQVRTAREGRLLGEDFTILRGRHRFLTESHVGMIYTRRAVRPDPAANRVASLTPDFHTLGLDFSTSTRRLRGNKNLTFDSHYVHTSNPAGTGHSGKYGARISYPNDVINMNFGFNEDQANLDPAVGFVSRLGKDWNGNFQFRPRPRNHPWIRQFSFGANYSATTSITNVLETHEINITAFQVNTHAGDNIRLQVTPNYDLLNTDFSMQGGIVLPKGSDYSFTRFSIGGDMSSRRPVAFRGSFSWGNYYGGKRREFNPGLDLRPRNGLIIELSGQWNRIELPQGRFSTNLWRSVINNQFNPWISVSSNLQYDSVSRVLGWQGRFRWILKPGNDLYFVYTRNWNNDVQAGITTIDYKAASKLVYTHRF